MKILLAAAVALSTLAAPSVLAQTAPTAKVFYGDLNLDSTAGQATLKTRISQAARNVCRSIDSNDIASRSAWQACFISAFTGAMSQMPATAPQFASR